MMASGEKEKYKGSIDCARKIYANEGINILRGVSEAGTLALYNKLQYYLLMAWLTIKKKGWRITESKNFYRSWHKVF